MANVPVSTAFDVFDWNPRGPVASDNGVTLDDSLYPFVAAVTANGSLVVDHQRIALAALGITQAAGVASTTLQLDRLVPDSYTFEVEMCLTDDTPDTWNDLANRMFVGVQNRYGYSAGFILTRQGIYTAVNADDTSPQMLRGSKAYLYDLQGAPQRVVLRVIVNSVTSRMAVYVGVASDTYARNYGSWWQHPNLALLANTPALIAGDAPDGLYVSLTAPSAAYATLHNKGATTGASSMLLLYALRLSTQLLIPVIPPTAAVNAPRQLQVHRATVLDGRGSTDQYGGALSYEWTIERAPDGSTAQLQGAKPATASTVLTGPATARDFFVQTRAKSGVGNAYTLSLVQVGNNAPLAVSYTDTLLRVQLHTDGFGVVTTTAEELVNALNAVGAYAYNTAVAAQFEATLALYGNGTGIVLPGDYVFAGGTGSPESAPVFVPDMAGTYVLSLRVRNATQQSNKVLATVVATETDELFGYRPDTDYIFKYLPDFWQMVTNKEQISSVWSAVAQIISAEMVQAWQNDYSKSIRDIGRKYQRRWLSYSTEITAPVAAAVLIPQLEAGAPGDVATLAVPTVGMVGYTVSTVTVPGMLVGQTLSRAVPKVLYRATGLRPQVARISDVSVDACVGKVTSATNTYPVFELLASGTTGTLVGSDLDTYWAFSGPGFQPVAVEASDVMLRVSAPGVPSKLLDVGAFYNNTALVLASAALVFPRETNNVTWELLRKRYTGRISYVPYIVFPANAILTTLDLQQGDLVRLLVQDPYGSGVLTAYVPIIAFDDTAVFVDWNSLLQLMTAAAIGGGSSDVWTLARLGDVACTVDAFIRTQRTETVTDLLSIPALSGNTIAPEYRESMDYTVTNGRVEMTPFVVSAMATIHGADKHVTLAGATYWYGLDGVIDYAVWQSSGATVVRVETGVNAGYYDLTGVPTAGVVATAGTFGVDEQAIVSLPRFTARNVPPARLWAEVSYFDNWEAIEGSFGTYVGLPKSMVEATGSGVDYLSVVRALCFAYTNGATAHNVSLVAEALMGVAYAEHRCQITSIIEPVDGNTPGWVIARDEFGRDVAHKYPFGAVLANNPTTGRQLRAFRLVTKPHALTAAETLIYADAVLPAYSRIFDAVKVYDYVSQPELCAGLGLQKYHTFVVDVPLDITRNTGMFPILTTYLREVKPAHTNFVLFGTLPLVDELVVEDLLTVGVQLRPKDTIHSAPFALSPTGKMRGVPMGYPLLYPTDGLAQKPDFDITQDDITRYGSGYQEGILDDYSGSGSWNRRVHLPDTVSQGDYADLDVMACRVWVPVVMQAGSEFQVGDEIRCKAPLALDLLADTPDDMSYRYLWNESPPVVLHVGAGHHPKLGFGIYSPQQQHPYTYLLLGFERPQSVASHSDYAQVVTNYGAADRLDGIYLASQLLGVDAQLVNGAGAIADTDAFPSVLLPNSKYLLAARMSAADKHDMNNPRDEVVAAVTTYIPVGGLTIAQTQSNFFPVAAVDYSSLSTKYGRQLQMLPLDGTVAPDEQFVPNSGPGIYTLWSGLLGTDMLRYGYTDNGVALGNPKALGDFLPDASSPLENVHVGYCMSRAGDYQFTNGFNKMVLPKPRLQLATYAWAGPDTLRVEGCYLINTDAVATTPVSADPTAFDGVVGGAWVYVVHQGTHTEYAAASVAFEIGNNAGLTVLGIPGTVQKSDGHVLNCTLPTLPAGTYTVLVRHFRPYKMTALAAQQVDLVTASLVSAFTV